MGSPVGPVLSGIFMTELENNEIPTFGDNITFWRSVWKTNEY